MLTRRSLLRSVVGVGAAGAVRLPRAAGAVTADDQRRWAGIVRDWHACDSTVLSQINEALFDEFPEEWKQPYRGFIYGFRGMFTGQDTTGVCGQWVALNHDKEIYIYASVPGDVVSRYAPGDCFNITNQFPREKLHTPAGFAELWAAVRASQGRLLRAVDQIAEGGDS